MYTAIDYLKWYGGVGIDVSPFNEVDYYILCKLCCLDLRGIVPSLEEGGMVTINQAVNRYFEQHEGEEINLGLLMAKEVVLACRLMAKVPRYMNMLVYGYAYDIDEAKVEQFCALTILPGDGSAYVTFCGTDDSIVAWKEDFNMSYCDEVPSQLDATLYLTAIGEKCTAPFRVGGHSKGGNLAVYSSMNCPTDIQDRIVEIYNFDGPGFGQATLHKEAYQRIRDRITTILPQTPVVGVLMEHEENFDVVRSDNFGPFQHNGFRWEVDGTHFVHLKSVSGGGRFLDERLGNWVKSVDMEQRCAFVNTLFDVLQCTGAKTLTDLSTSKLRNAVSMIRNYRELDKETKEALTETLGLLMKELTSFRNSDERRYKAHRSESGSKRKKNKKTEAEN